MRCSNRAVPLRAVGAAVLSAFLSSAALGDTPASSAEAAVWTPKELRFIYHGFTAKYSCDGLRDKVRKVLLNLGARKDLQVNETACAGSLGSPTAFPGVTIKMNVLELAYDRSSPPPELVPAHWKTVDLTASRDVVKEAGDCELIEQIKTSILPQFTTRDVHYSSTCIPHQLTIGGTHLKADVLIADDQGTKPTAPPASGP